MIINAVQKWISQSGQEIKAELGKVADEVKSLRNTYQSPAAVVSFSGLVEVFLDTTEPKTVDNFVRLERDCGWRLHRALSTTQEQDRILPSKPLVLEPIATRTYVDAFNHHVQGIFPLVPWRKLDHMVTQFLQDVEPTPSHLLENGDTRYTHQKPPERTVQNALILLIFAVGKLFGHHSQQYPNPDRPELDLASNFTTEIPGLDYADAAAGILGDHIQTSGLSLANAHIIASLYYAQLGLTIKSFYHIRFASSVVQDLLLEQ